MVTLPKLELRSRARAIRLVLTDVDGVLTDTGVFYSAEGELLNRFSVRDGMGVLLLREAGIETAFLTRETSGPVKARAAKLGLARSYHGVTDKLAHLPIILEETGLSTREVAFIGDDVNDVPLLAALMREALTGAPGDAMPAARDAAIFKGTVRGGEGAFREFADWILTNRS